MSLGKKSSPRLYGAIKQGEEALVLILFNIKLQRVLTMSNVNTQRIKTTARALIKWLSLTCLVALPVHATETADKPITVLPDPVNAPVVFVSSSCAACEVEKPMTIGFGADHDGMLTVLLITPDGEQSTLLNRAVKANAMDYVNAVSTAPIGDHVLIALFGAEPGDIEKSVSQLMPVQAASEGEGSEGNDVEQKGLTLLPQPVKLIPHAIRQFQIIE